MIEPPYLNALRHIHIHLKDCQSAWVVTGSLGLALQGMDLAIHDIDLQTDQPGAYEIERLLSEWVVKPVRYLASERICSYYGMLEMDGVKVEIMGDLQKLLADGSWEAPVPVQRYRQWVVREGMRLPVLSLAHEAEAYARLGRFERKECIRAWQPRVGSLRYPVVMFDWGDTLMKDDPTMDTPMCQWPSVETVDGAEELLRTLHARRTIVMATGAAQSDEAEIRLALRRVNLEQYFDHIFCFKNTGLRKPSVEFYRHILDHLQVSPADVLMVGDNFEGDVLAANRLGIAAVWLNRKNDEDRSAELHCTIHQLQELLMFLDDVR